MIIFCFVFVLLYFGFTFVLLKRLELGLPLLTKKTVPKKIAPIPIMTIKNTSRGGKK